MVDYVFKFGKHKGKSASSVDESYVVWFYENVDKSVCSKEYYEKIKEDLRIDSIAHECIMESMN